MWLRCPRQYDFRYWQGIKIRPVGVMIQGSAYHETVASYYKNKMKKMPVMEFELSSDKIMTSDWIEDTFSTSWESKLRGKITEKDADELELAPEEINWEGAEPGRVKDQGIKLVKSYIYNIGKAIEPIKVEEKVEMDFGSFVYVGYPDVETERNIIDHKIKSRMMSQQEADRDLQPISYLMLRNKRDFAYHIIIRSDKPREPVIVETRREVEDIEWWRRQVGLYVAAMDTGIAPPNPTSWLCSPKWCGYWDLCRRE